MSKKYSVIETQYKLSFAIKLGVILLISSIASVFVFQNFVRNETGASYKSTWFVVKSVRDFLFPSLWFSVTILTLLLAIGTIVVSIFVSHKIAGPIYRLEKALDDFKKGFFYKITLRAKDQITPVATLLNEFTKTLTNNFRKVKKSSANIRELIDNEKSESEKKDVDFEKISLLTVKIKDELGSLQEVMSSYKTAN